MQDEEGKGIITINTKEIKIILKGCCINFIATYLKNCRKWIIPGKIQMTNV